MNFRWFLRRLLLLLFSLMFLWQIVGECWNHQIISLTLPLVSCVCLKSRFVVIYVLSKFCLIFESVQLRAILLYEFMFVWEDFELLTRKTVWIPRDLKIHSVFFSWISLTFSSIFSVSYRYCNLQERFWHWIERSYLWVIKFVTVYQDKDCIIMK